MTVGGFHREAAAGRWFEMSLTELPVVVKSQQRHSAPKVQT